MSERERLPDTLATLDLNERPGQKITYFRHDMANAPWALARIAGRAGPRGARPC
jgi:hypothetical protein